MKTRDIETIGYLGLRTEKTAKAISAYYNKKIDNKPCYSIKAGVTGSVSGSGTVTEIYIYDVLGFPFNDINEIVKAVDSIKTDNILVRLNTPGGEIVDCLSLYQSLLNHKAKVTIRIDALAASAGSIIAMAGDTVQMYDTSLMMVHQAWVYLAGNKKEMQAMIQILEKIDASLTRIYKEKTGLSSSKIEAMMDAETWLSAEEAKDKGFADEIISSSGGVKSSPSSPVYDRSGLSAGDRLVKSFKDLASILEQERKERDLKELKTIIDRIL